MEYSHLYSHHSLDDEKIPTTEEVKLTYTYEPRLAGGISHILEARFDRWLVETIRAAKAEALREAARSMRSHKDPGHWNLRDEIDPVNAGQSPDAWLERRADRIENGADQ